MYNFIFFFLMLSWVACGYCIVNSEDIEFLQDAIDKEPALTVMLYVAPIFILISNLLGYCEAYDDVNI